MQNNMQYAKYGIKPNMQNTHSPALLMSTTTNDVYFPFFSGIHWQVIKGIQLEVLSSYST
jgi:hypothetical protein